MSVDPYDVTIVGAGPAGATAASRLGQQGRRVFLVDRAAEPGPEHQGGWLSAGGAALLSELGVKDESLLACPFRCVTFHRADFSQTTSPTFADVVGYLIDRSRFDRALVQAAGTHGAEVATGCAVIDVRLRESEVVVRLSDGRQVKSRLLLLAAGLETELAERIGLAPTPGGLIAGVAQVEAPVAGGGPSEGRVAVVLGLDNLGSFGVCCSSGDRVSITVHWLGESNKTIPALVHLCRQAFAHHVAPWDLSESARSAKVHRIPLSAALDMDSHVRKHTLVIGDAGGFTAAASGEGIYPAMWSATIAVEVIEKALQSVHSQDELMTFDSAWRMRMADYLRPPHTDIQFLIPLIFTNQPMADRMGAAFFFGENI